MQKEKFNLVSSGARDKYRSGNTSSTGKSRKQFKKSELSVLSAIEKDENRVKQGLH